MYKNAYQLIQLLEVTRRTLALYHRIAAGRLESVCIERRCAYE